MKGKQLRKAFAIIGGLFVSLVLAVAPAKAVFIFATAASDGTPTASISVADGIETPDLGSDLNVQGNNWLNQKVSLSGEALENNSTFHWTSTASSNASGNADIDDAGDGDVVKVGYLTSSTTVVSGYATANDGSKWPSAYASKTVNALAPENGLSATYTATSHYHIGQTIKFTLMETVLSSEITMAENLFSTTWIGSDVNGDQATIWGAEAAFYWGTSSSGTTSIGNDLGWGMTEGSYTHTSGSAVWSRQLPEPIFYTQTYYLRGAVYDNYTGLCSEWKTIATVSPVEAAADIATFQQPHESLGISSNPSSWALSYRTSVSFSYTDCGRYYTYYYYSTTNSKPAMPTDGFAGTNNGVWHRTGSTNSSFVIENLTSSRQTYYWWVWAGCSLTKTSTYSSAKSGAVTLSAAVAAPSCITAQNNLSIFARGASFEWRNNSSYTVYMTSQQTGDYSWGPDTNTAVAAGSSISFTRSWAGMTGGTIYSYCKITFSGVTSGWYKTWKDYNTGNATPNFTSYYGTSNPT